MDALLKKFLGIPKWADPEELRKATGTLTLEEMSLNSNIRINKKINNNIKDK